MWLVSRVVNVRFYNSAWRQKSFFRAKMNYFSRCVMSATEASLVLRSRRDVKNLSFVVLFRALGLNLQYCNK